MTFRKIKISGTGCALVDLLYTDIRFNSESFLKYSSLKAGDGGLSPGKLVFTEELERFAYCSYETILHDITGGIFPDTFNIGGPGLVPMIHVSQLLSKEHFDVRFFGLTGDDANAERIFELLKNTPLDISNYTTGSDKPTPFTDVFSDPTFDNGSGERTFVNNIGAAWDYFPESLGEDFFDADIVCFGGTALVPQLHDHLSELLALAKQKKCITIVNTVYDFRNEKANPNKRWPLVQRAEDFCLIDILIMDMEEALKISGEKQVKEAAAYFVQSGVSAFIITNGSGNVTAWSEGRVFRSLPLSEFPVSAMVAASKERKADTIGCGDNFTGGLVVSVAEQLKNSSAGDLDLGEALSWAIASGGFTCFYQGGTYFERASGEKRLIVEEYQKAYQKQISKEKD